MRTRSLLVVMTLLAPILACGGELPSVIRDEIVKTRETSATAATVVFFTDFQCPFCRRTHAALAPLLADGGRGRVRLVIRHVPLPRHPDARDAARAAVCVEALTPPALDDFVDALYQSPDLSQAACENLAIERGVDRARYEQCLADPTTDTRLEHDLAAFDAVRGDGVPLLYIGGVRLEGAQSASSLQTALDDARRRK